MEILFIRFLLFLLPLIVLPFGTSHFETPKVILAELCIQVLLYVSLWNKRFQIHKLLGYWPLAGIFIITVLQLFIGVNSSGLFGNPFRMQGMFFLWNMLVFAVMVSGFKPMRITVIYPYITLIGLLLSIWLYGVNAASRSIGSLGEPNAFAAAALFCGTLVVIRQKHLSGKMIAMGILITILAATRSRSAIVGFAIELLFLALLHWKLASFSRSLIVALFVLLMSSILPLFDTARVFESRAEIWSTAVYSGFHFPILGWGFGNAEVAIRWGAETLQNSIRFQYVDSAHNIFLDWWVMGGLTGIVLLITIVVKTLYSFSKHHMVVETTAFLGVLASLWFNPGSVYSLIIFWYLVGVGIRSWKSLQKLPIE